MCRSCTQSQGNAALWVPKPCQQAAARAGPCYHVVCCAVRAYGGVQGGDQAGDSISSGLVAVGRGCQVVQGWEPIDSLMILVLVIL